MIWPSVILKEGENPWITYFRQQTTIKNNCINGVCTGKPGVGKSWSALSQLAMFDPDFDLNEQCFFKASKMARAFSSDNFFNKKSKCIMFDEAGIDISSDRWQDEINRGLKAFFSTSRANNYIFLMTVPYINFISKGVRTLMNAHFRVEGWTNDNKTKVAPRILEYNPDMDKYYRKRLMVKKNGDFIYCNQLLMPKPPKNLRIEYEKLKKEFMTETFGDIADKIQAFEDKKSIKIRLTYRQDQVIDYLKQGMNVKEVAKKLECIETNVYQIIEAIRKKGIDIKSIKSNGSVERFHVPEIENNKFSKL